MMPNRDAAIERLRKAARTMLNRGMAPKTRRKAETEYREAYFVFPETERDPKHSLPDPKALLESLARQDLELARAKALEGVE